jgi:preprotein translocase subunit SecF
MEQEKLTNYKLKTLGRFFLLVGLVFLVIVAVYLNTEGHNIGVAAIILIIGILINVVGNILIFEAKNEREESV